MSFSDLAWEDLADWAGTRVVSRGKSYKRNVQELCLTGEEHLLATVQGGRRYLTRVECGVRNALSSVCTCPYGSACKHAVAAILVYLDMLQKGLTIPTAEPWGIGSACPPKPTW